MLNKGLHYWMMQYNQSRFKNIWINHQNKVFHELWQKQFRMGRVTPETDCPKQKKVTQKQLQLKNHWLQHHRDYQQEILNPISTGVFRGPVTLGERGGERILPPPP